MDLPSKTEAPTTAPTIVSFTNVANELGLREEQCEVRTSPNCLFDQFDQDLRKEKISLREVKFIYLRIDKLIYLFFY